MSGFVVTNGPTVMQTSLSVMPQYSYGNFFLFESLNNILLMLHNEKVVFTSIHVSFYEWTIKT